MDDITEKQGWHFLAVVVLAGLSFIILQSDEEFGAGRLWGIETSVWFWLAVFIAIFHQLFVWAAWRLQLSTKWVTKKFPEWGFTAYLVIFFILIISRLMFLIFTAISNRGTITIQDGIKWPLAVLLSVLVIWLFYSVIRYFGFKRAAGADHFYHEYLKLPLVKEGIFRYSRNAMYMYGFLIFWLIAILAESKAALLLAGFNHIYIWVHYYCTELPDMKRIYG